MLFKTQGRAMESAATALIAESWKEQQMPEPIVVKPFEWAHWIPMWQLVHAHLAEDDIILGPEDIPPIPPQAPEQIDRSGYEWDLEYIGPIYLRGAGGFWLAWCGNMPAGHVGAQDLSGTDVCVGVELRRMYVRAEYRRRGIGTRLVQALIEHCVVKGARAIELWTAQEGSGHALYARLGFVPMDQPGSGYERVATETGYQPGPDEIRMRLDLTAKDVCR
jgi:GNAT superfamily N-acetyltransferase